MDIALEIMRENGPSHESGDWARGDIVRVFQPHPNLVANPQCNMARKAYIIITDVPNRFVMRLKNKAEALEEDNAGVLLKKRLNKIDPADIPTAVRNALLNPPYVFVTNWDNAKAFYLRNKTDNSTETMEVIETNAEYDS